MASLQENVGELSFEKVWLMFQETDKKFQDTDKKMQDTDKQIKELGKQIGGLGNKFGTFNEGLFMPSLVKMLIGKFNCRSEAPRYRFNDNGNSFEIDLLGISDTACYIIEIKSHLTNEAVRQLKEIIKYFRKYDDVSKSKKIYGLICATDYNEKTSNHVIDNGFYFISTRDDIARLQVPEGFKPKEW